MKNQKEEKIQEITYTQDIDVTPTQNSSRKFRRCGPQDGTGPRRMFKGCPVFDVEPSDFYRNFHRQRYRRFENRYPEIKDHIQKYDRNYWVRNKKTGEMYKYNYRRMI